MRGLIRLLPFLLAVSLLISAASTLGQLPGVHEDEIGIVNDNDVNLRDGPSVASDIIYTLELGTELRVVSGGSVYAEGYTWWLVQEPLSGSIGWLPADFLELAGETAAPPFGTPVAGGCWNSDDVIHLADGSIRFGRNPSFVIDPFFEYTAEVLTSAGIVVLSLDAMRMPRTVNNFVCLARSGFYDGTSIHRIIPGILVQGGDPTGTGSGGPGYRFSNESFQPLYSAGVVAMANTGPDTNGSQFFIAVTDLQGRVDPSFPIFGQVSDGMDIIEEIASTPVEMNNRDEVSRPATTIVIESITIVELPPLAGPSVSPAPDLTATAYARSIAQAVVSGDIYFDPTEVTIAADTNVPFMLPNDGAAPHNFSIDELEVDIDIAPGEEEEVVINAPAGEYEYYCNVPGHREAGMVGTLVVE
ncbi:hypothetical protein BH24CHL4_BH24CHL4_04630 [soil metagenome]